MPSKSFNICERIFGDTARDRICYVKKLYGYRSVMWDLKNYFKFAHIWINSDDHHRRKSCYTIIFLLVKFLSILIGIIKNSFPIWWLPLFAENQIAHVLRRAHLNIRVHRTSSCLVLACYLAGVLKVKSVADTVCWQEEHRSASLTQYFLSVKLSLRRVLTRAWVSANISSV